MSRLRKPPAASPRVIRQAYARRLDDAKIFHVDAAASADQAKIAVPKVMAEIHHVRTCGFAVSENLIDDHASLAMQMIGVRQERPIALGLSIPTTELRLHKTDNVGLLREKIEEIASTRLDKSCK